MEEDLGSVVIAPEVLITIAKLTALATPGVARLQRLVGGVNRLLRWGAVDEGVRIDVQEGVVTVDLHIIAQPDVNMYQLGQQLQAEVTRAISDMVGMPVREVNVYIEDVEFPPPKPKSPQKKEGQG